MEFDAAHCMEEDHPGPPEDFEVEEQTSKKNCSNGLRGKEQKSYSIATQLVAITETYPGKGSPKICLQQQVSQEELEEYERIVTVFPFGHCNSVLALVLT